jgi:hypothetical protein
MLTTLLKPYDNKEVSIIENFSYLDNYQVVSFYIGNDVRNEVYLELSFDWKSINIIDFTKSPRNFAPQISKLMSGTRWVH